MRVTFSFLLLFTLSVVYADRQFEVFERGGFQGLAELPSGKEIIPPVYEKLGWTKGHFRLIGDVLGYKENGKWGLITTQNKRLYEPEFYQIDVLDEQHILAALKGTFTNQLYYGLINIKGEKKINCNYFDIQKIENAFLVSEYDGKRINQGIIDDNYQTLIKPRFKDVKYVNKYLWAAQDFYYKWHFFNNMGNEILTYGVDSFTPMESGIEVTYQGKKGFLSKSGNKIHDLEFKNIASTGTSVTSFPQWQILNSELEMYNTTNADSLGMRGDLFITYTNGNQNVLLDTERLYGEKTVELKDARSGYLVAKDLQSKKWSLITTGGKSIAENKDSIYFDGVYFYAIDGDSWEIFNQFGRQISARNFDRVSASVNTMVPVKKNNYWGLMDFQGAILNSIKYDSIGKGNGRLVAVKYLGEWGVMDGFGDWKIKPSFDQVFFHGTSIITRKGSLSSIYNSDGKLLEKYTYQLAPDKGFIKAVAFDSKFGAISSDGRLILSPIYEGITIGGNNFIADREGYKLMIDVYGRFLVPLDERVTYIGEFSEGYYHIVKDNSHGFVDDLGRLRIANRYEDAKAFHDDRAPIMLNGKWGCVDHREILVIQPLYEDMSTFDNGLAIVKKSGKFGLIDVDGNEVIKPEYEEIIHRRRKGYLIKTVDGKVGVADDSGVIILRPKFENIEESLNGLLIVTYEGNTGIMDDRGYTRVNLEYDDIKTLGDYFLLKKNVSGQ